MGRSIRRRVRRWLCAGGAGVVAVAALYLLLLAFPGALFAHHASRGAFRVRSDEPSDARIAATLDEAAARLARSPLDDPNMVHHVYICNGS